MAGFFDDIEGAVPVQPEQEWSLDPIERIKEGWDESVGALLGAGSMVADAMGLERGSEWLAQKAADRFERAADRDLVHTDFSQIVSDRDPVGAAKWVAELLVSYLPDLALMAVGGIGLGTGASRAAATNIGKRTVQNMLKTGFTKNKTILKEVLKKEGKSIAEEDLVKMAVKQTARDFGGLLGAASVEGLQEGGNFYLKDKENRGEDANPFRAMGVGLGVTAIGMLSPVTRGVAGAVSRGVPAKAASISLGKTFAGEFAEEMGQEGWTMLNEAGIDPNVSFADMLATPEGQMRLWESGVAGGVLGLSFGGAAKGITKAFEKKAPITDEEASGALERAGVDTSQDTILPRDIPNLQKPLPPSWTMEGERKNLEAKKRADELDRLDLETNEVASSLDRTPLEKIMIGPVSRVNEETGQVIEMEIPANIMVEESNETLKRWYNIMECLGK